MSNNRFRIDSKAKASVSRPFASVIDTAYLAMRRLSLFIVFIIPALIWAYKNYDHELGGLRIGGHFDAVCIAADGTERWRDVAKNGVVNVALNSILDVYLRNQAQITTWYLGLVDNAGFTAYNATDTMGSHTGWAESVAYSNSNRVTWTPAAAASQSISNTSSSDFSINATATIKGIFLTSSNSKSGTTGTLFATASFTGGNQTVNNGDTLKVTYTVNATSS